MKTRKILLMGVLVLLVAILAAGPVWAQAEGNKIPISGVATIVGFDPTNMKCIYPDGREHCRGMILYYWIDVSDDRFDGEAIIEVNYNWGWDPLHGPQWGTFYLENDGGTWTGTWTGVKEPNGATYVKGVGHGHGGYQGLKLLMSMARKEPPAVVTGFIIEPGN
jgi:hypothetical protein